MKKARKVKMATTNIVKQSISITRERISFMAAMLGLARRKISQASPVKQNSCNIRLMFSIK